MSSAEFTRPAPSPAGSAHDDDQDGNVAAILAVLFASVAFLLLIALFVVILQWRRDRKCMVRPDPMVEPMISKVVEAPTQLARPETATGYTQTSPQVFVELMRAEQQPLDLVCCLDSSVTVGAQDFLKSKQFLLEIIRELEMPAVQVGIIRFNHRFDVIHELATDSSKEEVVRAIKHMDFEAGETKLGPPLAKAHEWLLASGRKKVVMVVTDGDPNDRYEAELEADKLRDAGVLIVYVQVVETLTPEACEVAQRLAHGRQWRCAPEAGTSANYVFHHLQSYDELLDKSHNLLSAVLDVSLRVRRAKCVVDLHHYQEVADVDLVAGQEIMVPGWEPKRLNDIDTWVWTGQIEKCLQDEKIVLWNAHYDLAADRLALQPTPLETTLAPFSPVLPLEEPVGVPEFASEAKEACTQTSIPVSPQEVQTEAWEPTLPASKPVAETTRVRQWSDADAQTTPLVKVTLAPWRNAPLDLVICVDSSASFCFARSNRTTSQGRFVSSGNFELAKGFVERLAKRVDMPEVRLALLRFEDEVEVISHLTGNVDEFLQRLHAMQPSAGETKLAPPLERALKMLTSTSNNEGADAPEDTATMEFVEDSCGRENASKAVLVITDGDPNDVMDARKAASALDKHMCQLIFLRIGGGTRKDRLDEIARAAPRPSRAIADVITADEYQPTHVFEAPVGAAGMPTADPESLNALVPEVLRQVLNSTRRVGRARVAVPLEPYEVLNEDQFESVEGLDLHLADEDDGGPYIDQRPVLWDRLTNLELQVELAAMPARVVCGLARQCGIQVVPDAGREDSDEMKAACIQGLLAKVPTRQGALRSEVPETASKESLHVRALQTELEETQSQARSAQTLAKSLTQQLQDANAKSVAAEQAREMARQEAQQAKAEAEQLRQLLVEAQQASLPAKAPDETRWAPAVETREASIQAAAPVPLTGLVEEAMESLNQQLEAVQLQLKEARQEVDELRQELEDAKMKAVESEKCASELKATRRQARKAKAEVDALRRCLEEAREAGRKAEAEVQEAKHDASVLRKRLDEECSRNRPMQESVRARMLADAWKRRLEEREKEAC